MAGKTKPAKATKFKGTKDAKATRGASPGVAPRALDFGALVTAIGQVHERCAIQAGKAVNIAVTVRNWAIRCYIREYEQHGSDRAAYGVKLLDSLARRLASTRIVGLASRTLRQCRQFYVTYPGMWQALSAKSQGGLPLPGFWQTLSAELPTPTSITTRALAKQRETPTPDSSVDPTRLVWFKRNAMTAGDNPPVGLLLRTRKDHSLVEYALADLPNRLFVSKYQLELPTRDQLQKFLDAQLKEVGDA